MLRVGITGGIGSGKSTIAKMFAHLGIPVFDADRESKRLMAEDNNIKKEVIQIFGAPAYFDNGSINTAHIGNIAFGDPAKLKALNELMHPAVIEAGNKWMSRQSAPFALKEAAILFESGSHKALDLVIGVSAPRELRISRAMARSGQSRTQVEERMNNQMDEAEKMRLCNFVIVNDEKRPVLPQVLKIYEGLKAMNAEKS